MGYNVIDLIDRCVQIEKVQLKYLEEMIEKKTNEPTVQIMCKVFFKNSINCLSFYDNLKKSLDVSKLEDIWIATYDKISFLFNEFIRKIYLSDFNSPRKYLFFALDVAEDKRSLFIDVQGRLYNDSKDDNTITYKVLTQIIQRSEKQIWSIKKTLS